MTALTPGSCATQASGGLRRLEPGAGRERGELLRRLDALVVVDAREGLAPVERRAVAVVVAVVVGGERGLVGVAAAEQAARQRNPRDDADPGILRGGQHLVERLQPERVQHDLHARDVRPRDRRSAPRPTVSTLTP